VRAWPLGAGNAIVRIDFHDLVAETLGDGLELADLVVNGLIDGRRAHVKGGLHGAPIWAQKRVRLKPPKNQLEAVEI
jgi:hypothetical protein